MWDFAMGHFNSANLEFGACINFFIVGRITGEKIGAVLGICSFLMSFQD